MTHPDPQRLIARCAWLASHGDTVRQGERLLRHAMLQRVLQGHDLRPLAHDTLTMLQSEARLRRQGDRLQVVAKGEEFTKLETLANQLADRLRIELYAALIGQTSDAVAARCERRALALLKWMDHLLQESTRREAMLVLKAGFLVELNEQIDLPTEFVARDVADGIDYFFSQFVRVRSGAAYPYAASHPSPAEVQWTKLAPGLRHGVLAGCYRFGPFRANLLEISPKKWRLKVADVQLLPAAQRTLAALAAAAGAKHGTNGGFALSEDDDATLSARWGESLGLLISDGEVRQPPALIRTALLMDREGRVDIWRVSPIGLRLHIRQATVAVHKLDNERLLPGEIGVFTSHYRRPYPPATLYLSLLGRRVQDVWRDAAGETPVGGLLLAVNAGADHLGAFAEIEPGDLVRYEMPAMRGLNSLDAAVAGGPALVFDGMPDADLAADGFDGELPPVAVGSRTRHALSLHPRTAWGLTADHLLLAVTVDGHNVQEGVGIDLRDLARLMGDLGCRSAVNFEGGPAARMLVDGRHVDQNDAVDALTERPEDLPTRPLASAILVVERT